MSRLGSRAIAALVTDPAVRKWLGIERLQAAPERRARVSGDLRDGFQATSPGGPNLASSEQSASALIELRAHIVPALANRLCVDHVDRHSAVGRASEARCPESHHHMAPEHEQIHLFWWLS